MNSTKTIVLVAALAEYFPRVADDAGARLRRLHEEAVAGSRELDGNGRLVDDRHVPELLSFVYDFDTEYLNVVLLNSGPSTRTGRSISQPGTTTSIRAPSQSVKMTSAVGGTTPCPQDKP